MTTFANPGTNPESARLRAALERLDGLVDWERRARVPERGPRMRQSTAPARDLFDRLGSPDAALRCVLVAGTKGKGSVAALVGAGLAEPGVPVGVYGSPHVERVHERLRVDGADVADEALASALEAALDARDAALREGGAGGEATWFDVLTAAALVAFRAAGCHWAVLECGLGGRLDSTNAAAAVLTAVTNVDLEHTAILGATRAAIAREKAGIARAGVPFVSGVGAPGDEAADALEVVVRAAGAELVRVPGCDTGTIAERNLALARAILATLGVRPPESALEGVALPGRLERRRLGEVPVVLDGAHVPGSLRCVLADLERGPERLPGPPVVILGMGADKDAAGLLKVLQGRTDRVLCTSVGDGPYAAPEVLARLGRELGLEAQAVADPRAALDVARARAERAGGWILVTGSLHLVGRLRARVAAPARIPR